MGRGERPIFCIYARLLPAPRPATHQIPLDRNSPSPTPPRPSRHPPAAALRVHLSMPGTGGREGGEEGEEEVLTAEGGEAAMRDEAEEEAATTWRRGVR